MSDNLAVLSRVIARLNAGVVLAAFLLLAHGINSSTECWGNDLSVAGNGRPTGGSHEVGTSQIDRHVFGEDASHSSAFGYLDFDWTSDPRGEPRHENVPTHEGTARAEGLMNSILNWLTANFDLPVVRDTPRIEFIPLTLMAQIRYRGSASNQAMPLDMGRDIVAVYDDLKRTIYLPEAWTGVTPAEQSLLVHEMVHHMQNVGNLKYECPDAREKLAFAAQEQWLQLFDQTLAGEFGLDPFTLLVRTSCLG